MRALLCPRPHELTLVERPKPEVAPRSALVRLRRAGVCGADLHIFEGTQPYFAYPRVIGHELSGEVEAVGEGGRFQLGQRVAIIPYLHCGHCVACRRGKINCCQTARGSMCSACTATAAWRIGSASPTTISSMRAASVSTRPRWRNSSPSAPTPCDAAKSQPGRESSSWAPGQSASPAPPSHLREATMLDTRQDRLDFCREAIGVDHVVTAGPDARDRLGALTSGDFFDLRVRLHGLRQGDERGLSISRARRGLRCSAL
jgi:threonine dehydrogenase-like Zn-dependent dehydrogenase